jgi:signal transduction histidine kinase
VIVIQTLLITGLLAERRRRRFAEVEARHRLAELAHINRHATAGEMSASIAHELNQPLGAILANTETAESMLKSSAANLDEIKEILADIRRDDERATEIIRRLRRMLTKREPETSVLDINEMVLEVIKFLSVQASASNITLTSAPAPGPVLVRGDRIQLQQVILNLIVNGMEATAGSADGERRIVARSRANGAAVDVSITDSGHGIPSGKLKEVFEPFFTTKEHGMGMGLSIVRTIVEAHDGRVWAENLVGGGAVFHVSLPLAQAEAA